jgi:alcohol dehydrogenase class IV
VRYPPDFSLPSSIYIRNDIINDIGEIVKHSGNRIVLITTSPDFQIFQEAIEKIVQSLRKSGLNCLIFDDLPASPSTEDIDNAVSFVKKTTCDCIIGFGSIESLSAAKAVSLLAENFIFCHDLVENGNREVNPPLQLITIPGYPVFGMEIAPFFFTENIHTLSRMVYMSDYLYPTATIIDPTLSSYIDIDRFSRSALCTLAISAESVISKRNNDIANTFALKAIDFTFRNLIPAFRDPDNQTPRGFISSASVMSGIAFSSAMLSATLSISLALSSVTGISVQNSMCVILPHIMEFNLTSSPGKYVQMSKVMGEDVKDITIIEAAIKTIEAIRKLESDIEIPQRLSHYDVQKSLFKEIAALAVTYPFNDNAPREILVNEVESILIAAY